MLCLIETKTSKLLPNWVVKIKYKNGEVSLKVEDFYNFNKGRTSGRGRFGERLQDRGDLENYYIIVDVKFKL